MSGNWITEYLGTDAFTVEFMNEHLFFGRAELALETNLGPKGEVVPGGRVQRIYDTPYSLCLAEWIYYVPEPFKDYALTLGQEIWRQWVQESIHKASEASRHEFILLMQRRVHLDIETGVLRRVSAVNRLHRGN